MGMMQIVIEGYTNDTHVFNNCTNGTVFVNVLNAGESRRLSNYDIDEGRFLSTTDKPF